jgi:F-type H+-transporting ATPase subunit delta
MKAFAETLDSSAALRGVLVSPAVPTKRKRTVVMRLLPSEGVPELVRNFLFVVIDHRRVTLLGQILEAFEAVVDERRGVVKASVSSARPLEEKERFVLAGVLERLAGQKVRCEFATDPCLVGGAAAKIGSRVYDGSVRGELSALRRRLAR